MTLAQTAFASPDRHSVIVHVLETAVVTWMKQVKMALYCDPTGAIRRNGGKYAGPLEEVKVSCTSGYVREKGSKKVTERFLGGIKEEPPRRIELLTPGLRDQCSATELRRPRVT